MKILKIFGIVVGIHVFALILIFANPGCSSSTKPAPQPSDTVAAADPAPSVSLPAAPAAAPAPDPVLAPAPAVAAEPSATAPIAFNPDLPAVAAPVIPRGNPTRPNTPVASALVAEPVADVTPAKTYTVMSGDNLWNLSKKHGVPVSQLAAANSLKPSAVLHPGQKLIIPGKAPASTAASPAAPAAAPAKSAPASRAPDAASRPGSSGKHVVKPGEALSVIARQYGVSTGDLAVANNITDPRKLRSGMELVIPAPGSRGPKAAAPKVSEAAPKPAESAPVPTLNLGTPAPATDVPVIRVDENVLAPAPKK